MTTTVFRKSQGNCNENSVVREKDSFQVDLRVGVSQNAIHMDEKRMTNKYRHQWTSCKMNIAPIP